MEKRGDLTEQLMDFRTAYLRAVARASVDLAFRKKLVDPEKDPLAILKEEFGYDCPWQLTLVLHDNPQMGPRLNPAQGRIMTMPYYGESITLFIPRKPSGDPKKQLDALTAYYHETPWFLRNKQEMMEPVDRVVPKYVSNPPPLVDRKWTSVTAGRYNMGADINDFISFSAAIFNAVALAWDNEIMWNELISYQGGPDQPRGRTVTLLKEWLEYAYPWEIDLIIQEDKTAEYKPHAQHGKWARTTPPVLMLTLPWMSGVDPKLEVEAAPMEVSLNQKNPGVAIMGVALYNSDGPGYPFTCG